MLNCMSIQLLVQKASEMKEDPIIVLLHISLKQPVEKQTLWLEYLVLL